MRLRLVCSFAAGLAAVLLLTTGAAAQNAMPDLPGMGVASKATDTRSATRIAGGGAGVGAGTGTLGAAGRQTTRPQADTEQDQPLDAAAASPLLEATGEVQPASATTSDNSLPRSGAPVAAIMLLGVALVAGGRLVCEFVPRRVRATV